MNPWKACKNLLVIRLDNMGDLLMSVPAINALKETFNCKISVLTSSSAKGMGTLIPCVDEVIVYDVPWMKSRETCPDTLEVVTLIRDKQYDAAVIFTVFSQNPLPSVMLAYMAQIPLRLAYCRENPYALLTHWVPEEEPYTFVRHQVQRDLDLVKHIGAKTDNPKITIKLPVYAWESAELKLQHAGLNLSQPWMVFHPGVSETKRKYPTAHWIDLAKKVRDELNHQVILTGVTSEKPLTESIKIKAGDGTFSLAGELTLEEFIMLIHFSPVVISVNTSAAHIAAATQTKVIVLYATTNPQHTPWRVSGRIFPFAVPENLKSKNEILRYIDRKYFPDRIEFPFPGEIVTATSELLHSKEHNQLPDLFDFRTLDNTAPSGRRSGKATDQKSYKSRRLSEQ